MAKPVQDDPKKEKEGEVAHPPLVPATQVFKHATWRDISLIALGAFMSLALGAALPLFSVVLGDLFTDFTRPDADVLAAGRKYATLFGAIAAGAFVVALVSLSCMTIASEHITLRLRGLYLDAILRQEVAWFDQSSGGLGATISENTVVIREGLLKLAECSQFLSMFVAGFSIGFAYMWQLTLVILAITPLLALSGFLIMRVMADFTAEGLGAYATAGAVAEEALGMIRTVASFGRERFMVERYNAELRKAEVAGIKKALYQGLSISLMLGVYMGSYALAFWYGAKLINDSRADAAAEVPPSTASNPECFVGNTLSKAQGEALLCFPSSEDFFTFDTEADVCNCVACACGCFATNDCREGGDVLLVFFSVVIGGMALGQLASPLGAFTNARAAAAKIYAVLDREPEIRDDLDDGETLSSVDGRLALEGVHFHYPTRPDVQVFAGVDIEFKSGETTALVGGSGCGKSTVTQLLMRFYDPLQGRVTLDGRDVRELNLRWLRSQIGLVAQEPVLFACSVAENIAYGAGDAAVEVTRAQIEEAAKLANAFDFVRALPEGFDTFVGEGGSTLSGGQKQRIAIARALVRDPALLILDEATSALDNESERVVQAALNDLLREKRRTTIVVAHRLTTVRNADKIVVLGQGQGVLEQGTYDALAAKPSGHFAALLSAAKRTERQDNFHVEAQGDEVDDFDPEAVLRGESMDQREKSAQQQQLAAGAADPADSSDETGSGTLTEPTTRGRNSLKKKGANKKKKAKDHEDYKVPLRRVFKYSYPERWWYLPGAFAAAANGLVMPVFGLLLAEISTVFFQVTAKQVQDEANFYAYIFIGLAVIVAIANFFQFYIFGVVAERMTGRVRAALFEALIRQDIGYFDKRSNSVGALTSKLSTDAALVKASLADRLALVLQNFFTLVSGLGIAFYFGWKLTLVLLAIMPLVIIGSAMEMVVLGAFAKSDSKSLEEASQVLQESVGGVRTVTAFAMRGRVVALYKSFLEVPSRRAVRKGVLAGLGLGFSQATMFILYAIAFLVGSIFIDQGEYDFDQLTKVFFAVAFTSVGLGQTMAFTPDVAKAGAAISSVFKEIDRPKKIDPMDPSGVKAEAETNTDLELDLNVFAYPTRPKLPVLKDFSLTVPGGANVALVGMSGSGKSTALALLQRFYDAPEGTGSVKFHGIDVRDANVGWLRSRMGYVEQEPKLFDGTVFENLAFGVDDALVTQERVEEAAKAANAHDFIMGFPDGYQTKVGAKGSQLSGGQKQRVCIARMLMRQVDVFLLDEATAALDNESEALVQEAIDKVMAARPEVTTVTVAHKLKTIQAADIICVVHHGRIVEKGSHADLLERGGPYARLYQAQKKKGDA